MKPYYTHSNWTGRIPRTQSEAFGPMSSKLSFSNKPSNSVKYSRCLKFLGYTYLIAMIFVFSKQIF